MGRIFVVLVLGLMVIGAGCIGEGLDVKGSIYYLNNTKPIFRFKRIHDDKVVSFIVDQCYIEDVSVGEKSGVVVWGFCGGDSSPSIDRIEYGSLPEGYVLNIKPNPLRKGVRYRLTLLALKFTEILYFTGQ